MKVPCLLLLSLLPAAGQSGTAPSGGENSGNPDLEKKGTTIEPQRFDLGTIVVVGDRDGVAGSPVDTVDAAEILRFGRVTLADALRLIPGVTGSLNGPRHETGLLIRGFDLRQTPVFVDGIPVSVPYDGYVDMGRFLTDDLAEISVSKGFSSAVYGANTLGGAINLISRRPERPFEGDFRMGWLQEGGAHTALNAGGKTGDWYWQVSGAFLDADSFRLSNDFRPGPRSRPEKTRRRACSV